MRYADLHIHTYYSDSTFSPEEVVACAKEKGLAAIAICDHDCIDGIEPCEKLASRIGLEVIPGVELAVEKEDAEIHLLGYFINRKDESFRKKMKVLQDARIDRIHKMVEKLVLEGIPVKADEIFKLAGKGTVGRLHVAQAVLKTGKIKNFKEIFGKYIGFLKPCYVSSIRFTPKEAIETILKVGGVPVLAHPMTMGRDEYIPELIEYGLRGIEVYHTDHKASAQKHYEEIALRYGLLMTGGSDCHGMGKGRVLIGTVRVPYEIVEKLKEESGKISSDHSTRPTV
ncbi:MAG: PHP domain-containing protein [Candidatus Omnitrophota bacterium]|nr:PHP domain-containing protein [Candidatus Omnitrophota bacterium]